MKRLDKDTKGFTILEVLIALAIFSIGVLGIVKMQNTSTFHNVSSRLYTERATDAAAWIEQTMSLPYENNGNLATQSFDRYQITNTVTQQVLDSNHADTNVIDTVKRIEVSIWENSTGNLLFTTTYYMAVTY